MAPVNRTKERFYKETTIYGWLSFRDPEVSAFDDQQREVDISINR